MDKKKRTRELIVFAVIVLALLAGCLLTPSGGESEPIQEVMRDAVLHEQNKVSLFGLIEVNPGLISAYIVTGILIVFALVCRFFVIPKFKYVPGRFQLVLEQIVGMFDGLAEGSSPHRNKFLRAYIFTAGVYIFVSTLFELLGIQVVTTSGHAVSLPAPLSDINGAIALGVAHSVAKAANNMAEQPEAAGQIRTSMMMGLVFIETVIIYALIVAILIIFVL